MLHAKRIGRFEFQASTDSPSQLNCMKLWADHNNVGNRAYEVPNINLDEARDLIYGLKWMIGIIEEEDFKRRR